MAASRRDRALNRVGLALVMATSGFAVEACSLVLDVEGEQCTSDEDCVGLFGRGFECTPERVCVEPMMSSGDGDGDGDSGMPGDGGSNLPPEWACIEDDPRIVIPQQNRSLTLRLAVTDFLTLKQPQNLVGRACNGMDVDCSSPVIDDIMPVSDGYLEFEDLPHGWLGYLELEAPGYLPTLVFTNKPYTVDAMPEGPTLLTLNGLESITEGGGEMINEDRGIVLLAVYDCEGNPGEGVQLVQEERAGEEPEMPYYFEGSLPDRDRDETIISRRLTRTMNPLAVGGFNKVREGYQTFYGVLASTGQPIGRVTVQVRPLTMSISELHAGY
jgi:hypothetical protein